MAKMYNRFSAKTGKQLFLHKCVRCRGKQQWEYKKKNPAALKRIAIYHRKYRGRKMKDPVWREKQNAYSRKHRLEVKKAHL